MAALLMMIAGGALLSIQAGVNARLRALTGTPLLAALGSFTVGTTALLVVCLVARVPWPDPRRLASAPAWVWTGGLLGAVYLTLAAAFAARLGATALVAAVVAGQLACSVLLDHFGWAGFAVHRLSVGRAVGLALLAAGVVLVRGR